jgi:hypothetical protein
MMRLDDSQEIIEHGIFGILTEVMLFMYDRLYHRDGVTQLRTK